MSQITNVIEEIIKELTRLQTLPSCYSDKSDNFGLPRIIDAGDGGSILISRLIDQKIKTVADALMAEDASLPARFTRSEWRATVRRAFGPALARIELDDPLATNSTAVLAELRSATGPTSQFSEKQEFTFGCTLFGNTVIKPFSIGPVRFEPRLDWLIRKHDERFISDPTYRRIQRAWSEKNVRLSKRQPSFDSMHERDILDSIGTCPFVCSVIVEGLGQEAGLERALTVARMALAAMSLQWQTPSKTLDGLNLVFDRQVYRQRTLTFVGGKQILAGIRLSHMPHGPWMEEGQWESILHEKKSFFSIVAEVFHYVIDPAGSARPNIMNTLFQSLLWFHEGCRERVPLMAIVKYSATMDALATGDKSRGIRKLINARLGLQDDQPIAKNGPTLKQAIELIYSQGRSRTIHGTNDKLAHDWNDARALSELLARYCLLACIEWVGQHPQADNAKQLKV